MMIYAALEENMRSSVIYRDDNKDSDTWFVFTKVDSIEAARSIATAMNAEERTAG
jgi:hypothetical protein